MKRVIKIEQHPINEKRIGLVSYTQQDVPADLCISCAFIQYCLIPADLTQVRTIEPIKLNKKYQCGYSDDTNWRYIDAFNNIIEDD